MSTELARWIRRFDNYKRALAQLKAGVTLAGEREISDLEKDGLIQRFEYTQELAWNVIKDFYNDQGETGIQDSRDAFRMASERELVTQGSALMESIKIRNDLLNSYEKTTADGIFVGICQVYAAFLEIKTVLNARLPQRLSN